MNWRRWFPFLNWPRPTPRTLRKDAWAGMSVGLVLIPQSLAYATLAGMPPETGLYAALLPALVGILWGSSPLLAVGPVALTSLLTFASLQPLASPASPEWVSLAIWLALYSGLIQLLLGGLRLGMIANFVSYPVIAGFINAAALIIIFSQLPPLLGLPADVDAHWLAQVAGGLRDASWQGAATAAFGLTTLALLMVQKRLAPRLPGVLLVCLGGIGVSAAIGYSRYGAVVGSISAGFPALGRLPALGFDQHRALFPAAIIVALISFTEAMSSCRTLTRNRAERWDENQELIGQGLAKMASAASGAFPVSGSFSRSALNAYVGATSAWSTLFAAMCVMACLTWASAYLFHLPRAVLAAIIVVPVLGLIDLRQFGTLWRASRDDGLIALVTYVTTLVSVPYLHWGVLSGFVLSLLCYLYRRARPRIIEVGVHADGTLRGRDQHALAPLAPDVLAVRMDAAITYITAASLERFVADRAQATPGLRTVLLCCSSVNDIDATGIYSLRQLQSNLANAGIKVRLSAVKKQVYDVLKRTGLYREFGESAFFSTDSDAIATLTGNSPH